MSPMNSSGHLIDGHAGSRSTVQSVAGVAGRIAVHHKGRCFSSCSLPTRRILCQGQNARPGEVLREECWLWRECSACHHRIIEHSVLQTGVEFRDSAYVLSPKNSRILKTDMVINLGVGFADLVDTSGQK